MDTSDGPSSQESSKWIRKYAVPLAPQGSALVVAEGSDQKKLYWDRSHYNSKSAQIRALHNSATLYVGNLAFTTRTRQIVQHFAYLGPVKKVQMGLDRIKKTPCGFCFVEYDERRHALAAVAHLSGTKLDGNVIRVELDAGFQQGRQYGRGASGGQVRHDRKEQRNNKRSRYDREDVSAGAGTAATPTGAAASREDSSSLANNDNNNDSGPANQGDTAVKDDGGYYGPDGGDEEDETMEPSAKRQRL